MWFLGCVNGEMIGVCDVSGDGLGVCESEQCEVGYFARLFEFCSYLHFDAKFDSSFPPCLFGK